MNIFVYNRLIYVYVYIYIADRRGGRCASLCGSAASGENNIWTNTCIYMHTYINIHVNMDIYTYIYMFACICIYLKIMDLVDAQVTAAALRVVRRHIYGRLYMYVYVYVYAYICIYLYITDRHRYMYREVVDAQVTAAALRVVRIHINKETKP